MSKSIELLGTEAMTPQPTEAAKGPFTMTENAQGYWSIKGPSPVPGEWFRRVDAESNLRIVNSAWLAGRASGPTVDQIMEVVQEVDERWDVKMDFEAERDEEMRDGLTKLIEGK
jgi:hypothetical protein